MPTDWFARTPAASFVSIPRVTSSPLRKRQDVASACDQPGCARAEQETPTAAAHSFGNRLPGADCHTEHGAKGLRTPRIPSNQRKSASCSSLQVHTSPGEPRLSERSDGLAQAAETFGRRALALSFSAQCHPHLGVCLSRLGSGRSVGDTGPNIHCSGSGSRPPEFLISEPAVHGGSSAVIEPAPTPLSTRNFPQQTDKPKVFQENGLGVYCGSFRFSFR
jgi:hypothetical protein